MTSRTRRQVGTSDAACGLCGAGQLTVIESRATRRGLDWLNPSWTPDVRVHELCPVCGAKYRVQDGRRV